MGKYSRLGKNTLLVFVGNVGAKLIGLFMLPFYTNWLSVEDYGLTDIINVYVTFLANIVSCCIAESIFIFPKGQEKTIQKEYLSSGITFLFLCILLTAIIFGCINYLSNKYYFHNSFTNNIWWIYGMLVTTLIQQLFQQFTRSIDKMKVYSSTGVVLTISTALLSFLLIPRYGVIGYILAIIISNAISAFYSFILSKGYSYLSLKNIKKERCIEMLKYSVPLIPNGIMWWLVSSLNRPIMETCLGMHSIGILAVANKFPGILSMLFLVFANSWQISVLEEYKKPDFSKFYNKVFRVSIFILFILLGCITLCSKTLVELFSAEEYSEAAKYIPLLTLGMVFSSISGFTGSVFSAERKSKYYFYSSIWGALSAILANSILIPSLGIMGAALSVAVSFFIMALSRIIYSWKYVKINNIPYYIIMIIISIIMSLGTSFFLNFQLVILAFMFGILVNTDLMKTFYLRFKSF